MSHSANTKGSILIKRILREYIWQHYKILILAVICMIIVAAATAANAWLIQPVLDKIFIARDRQMMVWIPIAVGAIAIMGALANYGNTLAMRYIGQRVIADMQKRLFAHLIENDLGLFQAQASAKLITRFTNDIQLLRNAFSSVLTGLAKETLCLVFLVGVMIYQNASLAMLALIVFPIGIYPTIRFAKNIRKVSDKTQHELGEFASALDEVFTGVRTVKSYNRERFEITRANGIIESLFHLYFRTARVQAASSPIMEMLGGVSIALVIAYGGYQVLESKLTAGAFFSFIAAFLMAYKPVRAMAGLNSVLQEGIAAANRLYKVLDTKPTITDHPQATTLQITRGDIRYHNISFVYGEAGGGVSHIDLHIPAGKKVALVGQSGGGKSTLMNLLLRFYEVNSGTITIDEQNIQSVTQASLRAAMAFVPQEPMLFDDTIKANIAYGREGASDAEIIQAAKDAAADEFIQALPQGYETRIGSHGVRLSGGQRQRLAIARAMLKNAPILLLDEATSALDNESERSIQQALTRLMKNRTTLVIAHRLSTIVNADMIYVVARGRIVESGTHESLLAARGAYYQLYAQHEAEFLP